MRSILVYAVHHAHAGLDGYVFHILIIVFHAYEIWTELSDTRNSCISLTTTPKFAECKTEFYGRGKKDATHYLYRLCLYHEHQAVMESADTYMPSQPATSRRPPYLLKPGNPSPADERAETCCGAIPRCHTPGEAA